MEKSPEKHAASVSESSVELLRDHIGKNLEGYDHSLRIYSVTRVLKSVASSVGVSIVATSGGGNGDFTVSTLLNGTNTTATTVTENLMDATSGQVPVAGDIYLGGTLTCNDSRSEKNNDGLISGGVILPFKKSVTNVALNPTTVVGSPFSGQIRSGYAGTNVTSNDMRIYRFTEKGMHEGQLNGSKVMKVTDINTTSLGGRKHLEEPTFHFSRRMPDNGSASNVVSVVHFGSSAEGLGHRGDIPGSQECSATAFTATVDIAETDTFLHSQIWFTPIVFTDQGPINLEPMYVPVSNSGQRRSSYTFGLDLASVGDTVATDGYLNPGRNGCVIWGFALMSSTNIRVTTTTRGIATRYDEVSPRKVISIEAAGTDVPFKFVSVEYFLGKVDAPLGVQFSPETASPGHMNTQHNSNLGGVFIGGQTARKA